MKFGGKKIEGANVVIIPIPRGNTPAEALIFKAQAVLDMTEFDKLCPPPRASVKKRKDGAKVQNTADPVYKAAVQEYSERRTHYIVLKSLEATPDLEWETVQMSDASTWGNFQKELVDSGFSENEIVRLYTGVMEANGMSEQLVDEARKSFLARQEEAELESTSQTDELPTTPSSEPAND